MTQAVTFEFTSPQVAFESGLVAFTKGARLFFDGDFRVGRISGGAIDGVLVEGPIEFDAVLGDLVVVRREDGRRYKVEYFKVTGQLHERDLRAGRIPVTVHIPAIVIVKVIDHHGKPVARVNVNISLPHQEATKESPTDDRGEIVLLGAIGNYDACIAAVGNRPLWPPVRDSIRITAHDSGERVLLLRLPSS